MRLLATLLSTSALVLMAANAGAATQSAPQVERQLAQCYAAANGGHATELGAANQFLAPHRIRMRSICNEWRQLMASPAGRTTQATALLNRCLAEAADGPTRFHDASFRAHVRNGQAACRGLYSSTTGSAS